MTRGPRTPPRKRDFDAVELRNALIQAVNGNPVTADEAWALIHAWDKREYALERVRDWRGFRHTGDVREAASEALGG